MSAIGAASAALEIGEPIIVGGALHYTKKQYEEKISELEGYNIQLEQHLAELEGLKSEIPQFWDDEQGQKAMQSIEKAITQVKSASDRVQNLRGVYETTVNELEQQKSQASELLDEANTLLASLDIKG